MEIDYSNYTLEELYEVRENIDSYNYPERYEIVCSLITAKEQEIRESPERLQALQAQLREEDSIFRKYNILYVVARILLWGPFISFLAYYELENYERLFLLAMYFSILKICRNILIALEISWFDGLTQNIKETGTRKK